MNSYYVIKRNGKYLCGFDFKDDHDYRYKEQVSEFSYILSVKKMEMGFFRLAKHYDGKIKRITL